MFSYIGALSNVLGGCLLLPLAAAAFGPLRPIDLVAFTLPAVVMACVGLLLHVTCRQKQPPPMGTPEAAFIVTVVWMLATVAGGAPFVIGGILSPIDATFEAMSGWTTTGLTMVQPEAIPAIYNLWRSVMQFLGGAGLAVIMLTAIVGSIGPGVYAAEARTEHLVPHVRHTARWIFRIYIAYLAIGVGLYLIVGMPIFDSICHAMCALATGGFSVKNANIGAYNSLPIELVSVVLMIIGCVSFATHHTLIIHRGRKGWRDAELILMFWLLLLSIPIVARGLALGGPVPGPLGLRESLFHTVSALTGTGFSTRDLNLSLSGGDMVIFSLTILMLIEGGTGSTAGGIKQFRVAIILRSIWWWIKKQFYPTSAVIQRTIWRRGDRLEVRDRQLLAVVGFVGLYLLTYMAGVGVLLMDGYHLKESMFEYASAIGTIGLSVGLTSPQMHTPSKVACILGMWLGRLEFIAVFHAFIKVARDVAQRKGR